MQIRYPLLCLLLLCSIQSKAKEKERPSSPSFTPMEINHIRVANPLLFNAAHELHFFFKNPSHINKDLPPLYCFPLAGAKLISDYGSASGRKSHTGCDLKTKANDTIRAAFEGFVRMSKPYSGYGNVIVIRHSNGLETVYSHNSINWVQSGDYVQAGQAIGLTGRTGKASTEHLHFETRINGQHFNPHWVFNIDTYQLSNGKITISHNKKGEVQIKYNGNE